MVQCWKEKKGRLLRDKRGNVVGRPGDLVAWDDENARREPSAVRATVVDETPKIEVIEDTADEDCPLPPEEGYDEE